jgi:hypothetical protein
MEFKETFSREALQCARQQYLVAIRLEAIKRHVEQTFRLVLIAAQQGKTQFTIETQPDGFRVGDYTATPDDLLEGYRAKFPDCRVEYGETWEPSARNPNQMNKKSGIIIDWS